MMMTCWWCLSWQHHENDESDDDYHPLYTSGFETPPKGLKGYRGACNSLLHSNSLLILLLLLQASSPLLQSFHSGCLRPSRWTLDDEHQCAAKWYSCDRTVLLEVFTNSISSSDCANGLELNLFDRQAKPSQLLYWTPPRSTNILKETNFFPTDQNSLSAEHSVCPRFFHRKRFHREIHKYCTSNFHNTKEQVIKSLSRCSRLKG